MEPPVAFEANVVRDEKVKVLRSIRPQTPEEILRDTVRGQYAAGSIDGQPVPGYRQEANVAPDSGTETYVALEAPDRELALGRRAVLPPRRASACRKRVTEIAITFKTPPMPSSAGRASSSRSRTSSSSASSPTRESPCASGPSSPARRCASSR